MLSLLDADRRVNDLAKYMTGTVLESDGLFVSPFFSSPSSPPPPPKKKKKKKFFKTTFYHICPPPPPPPQKKKKKMEIKNMGEKKNQILNHKYYKVEVFRGLQRL